MASRLLARIHPTWFALVTGACIALLLFMGSLRILAGVEVRGFDLDGETNVPTTFSAGLHGLGALLALVLAGTAPRRNALLAFSAFLVLLALIESFNLLGRIQGDDHTIFRNATNVPLAVVGGLIILAVYRRLRAISTTAARLLVAGVGAWFVAQVIDTLQSRGEPKWSSIPEEGLEMVGSTLFALALLLALRAVTRVEPTASVGRTGLG